jgi:hypothetical protein
VTSASGKVSTLKTGARKVTLTNGSGDLTVIANPDGGLHTLAYDGTTHDLNDDKFDVLRGTFVYTHGVPTGFTSGDTSSDPSAGASTIDPGILKGLDSLAAGPVWTVLTDPLGHTTRALMDSADRLVPLIGPDGGVTAEWRFGVGYPLRLPTRSPPFDNRQGSSQVLLAVASQQPAVVGPLKQRQELATEQTVRRPPRRKKLGRHDNQ